ncbi:MAG: heparinase II/III family protein [Reinekea sp.]
MFAEQLTHLPVEIGDYLPLADSVTVSNGNKSAILARANAAQLQNWPQLPASLYLKYYRTGNRTEFEAPYFQRRQQLADLVLGEYIGRQESYIDNIIDGLFLICEETGWQLPAHNAYQRDIPTLPLAISNRPVLDLFAAETAVLLALTVYLLKPSLDSLDPEISNRIGRELQHRVIKPYLDEHFWWMGDGKSKMNNWTTWCTQNVLLASLLLPQSPITREQVIRKAAFSLDDFMKDYGNDGGCAEGPYYYRHAGLCLLQSLDILSNVAPQAFESLWHESKIRNIGDFIVHTHIADDRYHNYSDCPARQNVSAIAEIKHGYKIRSTLFCIYCWQCWQLTEQKPAVEDSLLHRLQALHLEDEMKAYHPEQIPRPDRYFPSIGLLTASDHQFHLAVKAGRNDNSGHNHNDVGNINLYKNGQPVLIDIGNESYTAKTFSPQRYEIWTMQSAFHNLPTVGGVQQQDGEAFAANEIEVSADPYQTSIRMNLASAYPEGAQLLTYQRTVTLHKERSVEIEDIAITEQPIELSLMLALAPTINGQYIQVGDLAELYIEGANQIEVDPLPLTDPLLLRAWPTGVLYRLRIGLTSCHRVKIRIC